MVFKQKKFSIEFTEECIEEMIEIYDYIAIKLKGKESAKKLMQEVSKRVLSLTETPKLYMKIGKTDRLDREYHRIVIKNYVVLYTVDLEKRKVFISHMIYKKCIHIQKERMIILQHMMGSLMQGKKMQHIKQIITIKRITK